jgi:CheY-like chemotaxis protein
MFKLKDPDEIGCIRSERNPSSDSQMNRSDVCPGPECSAFLECLEEMLWYVSRKLEIAKKLERLEPRNDNGRTKAKIADILGHIEYLSMRGPLKFASDEISGITKLRNETTEIRNRQKEAYSKTGDDLNSVKHPRILVVDDESVIRELISEILKPSGFIVETAPNGLIALKLLNMGHHDLVLVDLKMPGIDGLDFIRRAKENHPDTEFAIVTGYASLESAVDAINLGVSAYLHKPLSSADELISMVKRVLKVKQN